MAHRGARLQAPESRRGGVLGDRRGSAAAARTLYEDLTPPEPPRALRAAAIHRAVGAGRPTKRERRAIERLRGR
jgi:ribosome-associated heat shock protein Hsp15